MSKPLKAAILAAGAGTRMRTDGSDLPKVMRLANGVPLLGHVLRALNFIAPEDIILIVGYRRDMVTNAFPGYPAAVQKEQLGTGHAARAALELLDGYDGDLLLCCGDMPLLRRETYQALAEVHRAEGNACTILSGTASSPLPYGRILRDGDGAFAGIVEERDATPIQREIRELNSAVYVFDMRALRPALDALSPTNNQGEYYLTDAPLIIKAGGGKVGVCKRGLGSEILGVNTPEQLSEVERELRKREGL